MFASLLAVASIAALAIVGSAPLALHSECSTGSISCCNNVQQASELQSLFSHFGLVNILTGVTGQVVTTCTPISVIGAGGNSCTAQAVCCSGNHFDGLIQTGCTPVNLNI